jgi:2-oxoglutarate ferredoxin oxidoreductase subunit delta
MKPDHGLHHGIHHSQQMSETTDFIQLDIRRCRACWKCIKVCKEGVIGKIDILVHKHAVVRNPERCRGCLRCANVCENQTITELERPANTSKR